MANILKRTWALIKKAGELENDAIFIIETSLLGGYFALSRFPKYIVDTHGIYYSEIDYDSLPWYIPKGLYRRYNKFLEKIGAKQAEKVITVSDSMSKFVVNEFEVSANKVARVSNGYFSLIIDEISRKNIEEERGMVTFVGNLAQWANIDKIIRTAKKLESEDVKFVIVGDGPYRENLENLLNTYRLKNVVFTGRLPLDRAYSMIARSEIMLLPFRKALYAEVACPIKVLEYMAFGKAMVIDEVDDISRILKENDAALTCNPDNEEEFAKNILILLNDKSLRKKIGKNAKRLSVEFSWEKQGQKLINVLGDANGNKRSKSNSQPIENE